MSTADLERELARLRHRERNVPPSNAVPLTIDDALAYRDAGNLPDELGRTLRLVLRIDDAADIRALDTKRLRYEPDYHDPPNWRREGSAKVNVVPLRAPGVSAPAPPETWRDDPKMHELEHEWQTSGRVEGMRVPGEWRGFVFKTVAALGVAGRPVTSDTVADSAARWLPPDDAARLRAALRDANSAD